MEQRGDYPRTQLATKEGSRRVCWTLLAVLQNVVLESPHPQISVVRNFWAGSSSLADSLQRTVSQEFTLFEVTQNPKLPCFSGIQTQHTDYDTVQTESPNEMKLVTIARFVCFARVGHGAVNLSSELYVCISSSMS